MGEDYFYFPMDGNSFKYNQDIAKDYSRYLDAEDELEDMILDGILEIYVDSTGRFYYFPSEKTMKALGEFAKDAKFCDFSVFLEHRGLSINTFRLYKDLYKKRNKR
jgi:hypothetical protein